jgi:quinol monooxygenase YgiN
MTSEAEGTVFATITTGRFAPGRRQEAIGVLARMVELDRSEPGTLVQAFHIDRSDPDVLRVYELWASPAALEAHRRNGAHLRAELGPLIVGDFEVHACAPLFAKGIEFPES